MYGTLDDFDRLVAAAHDAGLRVLMDLVPCHTSIEHPWFRERPELVHLGRRRQRRRTTGWPPSAGRRGPATTARGRWYLHSFYPEQPDLDWRNPDVVAAMQDVVRFWLDRGVDGFRLDAIDRLVKDPELRDDPPATAPFGLPLPEEYARLEHLHSTNSPDIAHALAALREAAGRRAAGGRGLPARRRRPAPYLEHLDAAFAFELFHAPWDAEALRRGDRGLTPAAAGGAWVLSNHDFPRLPDALRARERARRGDAAAHAARAGVRLPGRRDRPGRRPGRASATSTARAATRCRHPMQWEPDPRTAASPNGEPWLPPVDPAERNVAGQAGDRARCCELYRELIALRPQLGRRPGAARRRAWRRRRTARGARVAVNTDDTARPYRSRARAGDRPGRGDGRSLQVVARYGLLASPGVGVRDRSEERTSDSPSLALRASTLVVARRLRLRLTRRPAGARTLNWYVFNEPGGAYEPAIATCNKQANGRYKIEYAAPAHRRQPAARADRAPAGGRGRQLDLMGMDVIWTAEFAEAEWILPWDGARRRAGDGGQARGPAARPSSTRTRCGRPVHHQHPAALVPQGQGRRSPPRPGTR